MKQYVPDLFGIKTHVDDTILTCLASDRFMAKVVDVYPEKGTVRAKVIFDYRISDTSYPKDKIVSLHYSNFININPIIEKHPEMFI
jgi:hypothetical protein